jgi:replicative DNA helicase
MQNATLELEDRTAASEGSADAPLLEAGCLLGDLLGDLAARHTTRQGGGWTGGLRCGFRLIDQELRGLRPGSITILSAEPTIGKSTLANQLCYQAAMFTGQSAAALSVSFEDDPTYLVLKQLSRCSGWPINTLLDGDVPPNDARLQEGVRRLAQARLYYLRGNAAVTPDKIIERATEAKALSGREDLLLVIDYLQYFARFAAGKNALEQVGTTLAELARIADQTGAALLAIGSQNREANKSSEPTMFGGRNSGEIEYDADQLLVLTKGTDPVPVGQPRTLTLKKARFGGGETSTKLVFRTDLGLFEEVAR